MKDLVTEFQTHADKMGQIASFAAASSTDAKRKFFSLFFSKLNQSITGVSSIFVEYQLLWISL